jgi:hypothetical protein
MNKKTLHVLKLSIQKWRGVCRGKEDHGVQDCALCQIFMKNGRCGECPVRQHSGKHSCFGTPYASWSTHHQANHNYDFENGLRKQKGCQECKTFARAELDFLKSLLPEGEKA